MPRDIIDMETRSYSTLLNPFHDIKRRDGQIFSNEDEDALLEFGGMFCMLRCILSLLDSQSEIPSRPVEAAPVQGDAQNSSHVLNGCIPTEEALGWARIHDENEDEDEYVDEFSGLREFFKMLAMAAEIDQTESIGMYPPADDELSQVGASWGRNTGSSRRLERVDGEPMTEDDDDALMRYGAWVWMSTTLIGIYRRTFGYVLSGNPSKGAIRRTPSGAELSAALGRTIQTSLGLDDPKRKVHARGIL